MANAKDDCIFCKIVKGEIPSTKVYDSENFIGILDIHPKAEGHTLIISKQHFENIIEMPFSLGGELLEALKEIGLGLVKNRKGGASLESADSKGDAFNVIVNNGEAAGMVVHHFHCHVIPRKSGDGLKGLA